MLLLCAGLALFCTGCEQNAPDKIHKIQLMYNGDIGYQWYLDNAPELQMVAIIDTDATPGAFEPTQLAEPYTQTFTFKLINPKISTETVVFKYKHHAEKDEPHYEGIREFELTPMDFE